MPFLYGYVVLWQILRKLYCFLKNCFIKFFISLYCFTILNSQLVKLDKLVLAYLALQFMSSVLFFFFNIFVGV